MANASFVPYRAADAQSARCLLCASEGPPGSTCSVCILPRPALGPEPAQMLACVRCKSPLAPIDVGAGGAVHACTRCARLFVPPRAWSRAFAARDVVADLETRLGQPPHGEVSPLGACPVCARQMDRARFAATSGVVLDACNANHGVWIANGDLGRAVDYAAHKARIGDEAAVREADAAWMKQNNVDPRAHAIATEEARIRAASATRMALYAKYSAGGIALVVALRLLLGFALRHHQAHASAPQKAVATAQANGAAQLEKEE